MASKLCAVKCMIWNESAFTVSRLIYDELGKKPKKGSIGFSVKDYLFVFNPKSPPPRCKEGFTLV